MRKILRKRLVLATTLLSVLSLAGCSGAMVDSKVKEVESVDTQVEEVENVDEHIEDEDVYIIGGIGPLTGGQSFYGTCVKQGAEIAVQKINVEGGVNGKQLVLVFEDDACDTDKAISAYKKIMTKDPVAIMGAVTSDCSISVSEESAKDGILQLTPSASAIKCTAETNSFRVCFTDIVQGETMAKFVAERGFKNAAVIYEAHSDYSEGVKDAFVTEATKNGINIVAQESFDSGDVNFETQLTNIKDTNAECIFLPIYYQEVADITQQAKTVGLELPYFGCDGWDGVIKELEGDTSGVEGAVFLTPFIAALDLPEIKAFSRVYSQLYEMAPNQFSADGYDAVYAIKRVIEECGNEVTDEKMINAMTRVSVKGLTGQMTFTQEGEVDKTPKFAEIRDGLYINVQ